MMIDLHSCKFKGMFENIWMNWNDADATFLWSQNFKANDKQPEYNTTYVENMYYLQRFQTDYDFSLVNQ